MLEWVGDNMTIGEKIKELKEDLEIECYYISRPSNISTCLVYTYTEVPNLIGDMEEIGTRYTILFNLYCVKEIEKTKDLIKKALVNHGFKKKNIIGPIKEDGVYNTAMQYTISLKN